MKKIVLPFFVVLILVLSGCEGSDVYQGNWKALNGEGAQLEITFDPNTMTLKSENEEESGSWEYSQNSVHIENGTRRYGIKLENGRSYSILFPISGDTEKGAIADANGNLLFIIGKARYYTYEEVYGLTD